MPEQRFVPPSFDRLRVRPGEKVRIDKLDPGDLSAYNGRKGEAKAAIPRLRGELDRLQELVYADGHRAVLVVLQGMDTAGKDGTIRHVFHGVNPQGVAVRSFKAPTPEELAHDFLWRIHPHTPGKGEFVIFNRSHYEDLLAVRVHHLVPRSTWSRRFDAINRFERELSNEGTLVLKFFLHISKAEQRNRLLARLEDRTKRWKLSPSDPTERTFWDAYMEAYQDVLQRTSTDWAPWYWIPSDRKWFRNLAVSSILVEWLSQLSLRYPTPKVSRRNFKMD